MALTILPVPEVIACRQLKPVLYLPWQRLCTGDTAEIEYIEVAIQLVSPKIPIHDFTAQLFKPMYVRSFTFQRTQNSVQYIVHEHFLLNYLQKPIFEKTTFININRHNIFFHSCKTIFLTKIWRILSFFLACLWKI